ncbi:Nitrate/nitrite transporter NarK [Bradyrhizobium lablabi]|uniref:Nitrate/nitrite transporter NarK n=2 Tax=Bradyrhizobium lablabi TaxID=722472 RepID=A0A1M6NIU1_9BRAD|nr:Nitrate/nitrite transporter NarK [Bradyrhizobium lablabi]
MKPRIGVYLSDGMAARLAEAATRPGVTKSALVEEALDRLLGSEDDFSDTATLARQFAAMSGQLEQLDRNLRIVNETVALHARFHLAVTPLLPAAAQEAAFALGAKRFEEFAAQVERRVDRGVPLIQETIDRVSAARAAAPRDDVLKARFIDTTISRGNNDDNNEDEAAVPEKSAQSSRVTGRQVAANLAANGSLILRVFLPFVTGYYAAYLFRSINAVMATPLATDLGLGAGDLGLLTSVYFLTFAAAQIPIGILLDRYGPRRVQSALMVVAALGSALFAASENFPMLLLGRALIGLGVAAALTAGMQALVLWFPRERVPLLNGLMVMLGALGAVTATWPAELLLARIGWRELFGLLAALTAVCAILVHLVVPEAAPARSKAVSVGLKKVFGDPRFWRLAPLSASSIGTAWALQGLWAAQWFADVDGFDRAGVVRHLFMMAIALGVGGIGLGIAADRLRRRGVGPEVLLGLVATLFIAIQLALILRLPLPSYVLWSGVAATGAATVLSYAILAEYFPKALTGRANGALNLFHVAMAFAVQYATGLVVQQWLPDAGHYPEEAYRTAFALNVAFQVAAWIWFVMPRASLRPPVAWRPRPSES